MDFDEDGLYKPFCRLSEKKEETIKLLKDKCEKKYGLLKKKKTCYFTGKKLLETYISQTSGSTDSIDEESGTKYLEEMCSCGYFIEVALNKSELSDGKIEKLLTLTQSKSTSQIDKISETEKLRKKKLVKLTILEENKFNDSDETYYIWNYVESGYMNYIIPIAIVLCVGVYYLSPIWPQSAHESFKYISYACLFLMGVFFVIVIVRFLVFFVVYTFTRGKMYFWILPNFTEDCGFFDSFKPLYNIQYGEKKLPVVKKKRVGIWRLLIESFYYIFENDDESLDSDKDLSKVDNDPSFPCESK